MKPLAKIRVLVVELVVLKMVVIILRATRKGAMKRAIAALNSSLFFNSILPFLKRELNLSYKPADLLCYDLCTWLWSFGTRVLNFRL